MRNNSIRILHVLKGMNPGGIETWLMHVLRHIDLQRYCFDFLTTTDAPCTYDDEIRSLGCRLIPCMRPHSPPHFAWNFLHLIREYGPFDVLHSHVHHYSGYACMLGKMAGIKVRIAHSHSDARPIEARAGFARRGYLYLTGTMIAKYATHGLACSELAAEDLFGLNWKNDPRWRVLHCGIDLTPFSQAGDCHEVRREFGFPPGSIVIGHVGRFAEPKNHSFLVEVMHEAVRLDSRVHGLLVGDGPMRIAIEEKVRSLNLEHRVIFAGLRHDVPRLLNSAMDVFLFPSRYEGLPLGLVEAQAAGLPCLVSDCVSREAAVMKESVKFISLNEKPKVWARILLDYLASVNVNKRESLEALGRSDFSMSQSLNALEQVYHRAVG